MSFTAVAGAGSELIGTIGGLFGGGGLRPCEEYAARAGQQAANVSADQARRAWDAVGRSTARQILSFPPQDRFCETGDVSIACSGGFDSAAFQQAGGPGLLSAASRVLRTVGVPTDSGCSEMIQVAKIVLGKWTPSASVPTATGGSSPAGGGGSTFGISGTALAAVGALGVVLLVGKG